MWRYQLAYAHSTYTFALSTHTQICATSHTHTHTHIYICIYVGMWVEWRNSYVFTKRYTYIYTRYRNDNQLFWNRIFTVYIHTFIYSVYIFICIYIYISISNLMADDLFYEGNDIFLVFVDQIATNITVHTHTHTYIYNWRRFV